MPRASYNDTCPVFLRPSQSIPTETSVYLAITLPGELPHDSCDDVCPGSSSMPLATILKYPLQFISSIFSFFLLCQRIRLWLAGLQNIGNWNKISPFGIRYSVFNLRLWNRMKVLTLYRCVFKFLIIETFWCYIYQRLISYYRCLFNSLYILFTINENISNKYDKKE